MFSCVQFHGLYVRPTVYPELTEESVKVFIS